MTQNDIQHSTFPYDLAYESDLDVLKVTGEGEPDDETLRAMRIMESMPTDADLQRTAFLVMEREKEKVAKMMNLAPANSNDNEMAKACVDTIEPNPNDVLESCFPQFAKTTIQKDGHRPTPSETMNRLMGRNTEDEGTGQPMGRPRKARSGGLNANLRKELTTAKAMSKAIEFPKGSRFRLTFHDIDVDGENLTYNVILAGPALIAVDPDAPDAPDQE